MAFAQLGTGAACLRVQASGDSIVVDLRSSGLDASVEVAAFLGQGFADLTIEADDNVVRFASDLRTLLG